MYIQSLYVSTSRNSPEKTKMLTLRISEADFKNWRDAAITDRMPLADWIRRRCDGRPASAPKLSKVPR